ncbi:hypothetical protein EMCG_01643 [[Emmonsia] crescens]|uniref:Uncharacterized protein n=1 Tax=[Emmonsia] crescens TaxID=73230 RepID=A0A0G2J2F2_9EURO|nr:hypothetical protein EMCG_01643 [Emmonsia crescens UAMH 3008]
MADYGGDLSPNRRYFHWRRFFTIAIIGDGASDQSLLSHMASAAEEIILPAFYTEPRTSKLTIWDTGAGCHLVHSKNFFMSLYKIEKDPTIRVTNKAILNSSELRQDCPETALYGRMAPTPSYECQEIHALNSPSLARINYHSAKPMLKPVKNALCCRPTTTPMEEKVGFADDEDLVSDLFSILPAIPGLILLLQPASLDGLTLGLLRKTGWHSYTPTLNLDLLLYIIYMAGGPVAWRSSKQTGVSKSSTEVEYISSSEAAYEFIHLRELLADAGFLPTRRF